MIPEYPEIQIKSLFKTDADSNALNFSTAIYIERDGKVYRCLVKETYDWEDDINRTKRIFKKKVHVYLKTAHPKQRDIKHLFSLAEGKEPTVGEIAIFNEIEQDNYLLKFLGLRK